VVRGHRLSHTVVNIVSKGFVLLLLLLSLLVNIIDYHISAFVLAQRPNTTKIANRESSLRFRNIKRHWMIGHTKQQVKM
jgi:hypothetical protein